MGNDMKAAVECGYCPLFRCDSRRKKALCELSFWLEEKIVNGKVADVLPTQNRYAQLERSDAADAKKVVSDLICDLTERMELMKRCAKDTGVTAVRKFVDVLEAFRLLPRLLFPPPPPASRFSLPSLALPLLLPLHTLPLPSPFKNNKLQ